MPVEIIQPQEGYVRVLGVGTPAPLTEVPYLVTGGTTGTQPSFTGDPLFTGGYIKDGGLVHFRVDVDFDNITSFGTGQYYLTLPFQSKHSYQLSDGCLHDISADRTYPISGHVAANSNQLFLESMDAQGNAVFNIDFTATAPVALATADNFHVAGTYMIIEGD
jgi:hypothetical protein